MLFKIKFLHGRICTVYLFKILVQYVMPVKVEGIYPNSFRCMYKNESLAVSFSCMAKLSSRLFICSVGQVRCSCTDNWLIYSQMQICLFKYMPCLRVYLLVGAIVSLAQKNIALSHIIIHKGSFLSYFCSCTIFMIAIWYLSSFKVIKWLRILLLTSRCNIQTVLPSILVI